MIAPARWREELVGLGLTGYEARAYLALLARDHYTAGELARACGVPRQRVYDVLAGLTERGLVRAQPGRAVHYTAIQPQAAIGVLIGAHRAAAAQRERTAEHLIRALTPAWAAGRSHAGPLDYIDIIRDRQTLATRFKDLQSSARRELLVTVKLPHAITHNPVSLPTTRRLVAVGGQVRCVYEHAVRTQEDLVRQIAEFAAVGEQARFTRTVLMRMCIADRTRALMSLPDPSSATTPAPTS